MASFFDNGPLPDWKEIRQWLSKDIPWHLIEKWDKVQDGAWMDQLVDRLVRDRGDRTDTASANEASSTRNSGESRHPGKAKSNDYVQFRTIKEPKKLIVNIQLPWGINRHELRLYAGSDRLRVAGLPGGRSRSVQLPCRVYPKSGKTSMKNGNMRVEFRRRPMNSEEVELFIRP